MAWFVAVGLTNALLATAISSLAIAGDGRRLAAGAADGSVLVWDLSSGEQLARLAGQDAAVSCIRWSRAGDRLAVALGRWSDREQASLVIWSPDCPLISSWQNEKLASGAGTEFENGME